MSEIITKCEEKMNKTIDALDKEYASIRAGRANPLKLGAPAKKARGGACRNRVQWHVDARHSVSEHAR